jgi:hypothetical protein
MNLLVYRYSPNCQPVWASILLKMVDSELEISAYKHTKASDEVGKIIRLNN